MPAPKTPHSRIERLGDRRALEIRREISVQLRRAREDAGLSQRALARAAGVSSATMSTLERGSHDPSAVVLARVATALGMELSVRLYAGTGPLVRDHLQAAMLEALVTCLHRSWSVKPEVSVRHPVRGAIDLVLERSDPPLIACEAHSDLRRLEQQLRWAEAKSSALAEARRRPVARLLLLRNTTRMRSLAAEFGRLLAASYPADSASAMAALTDGSAWPGDAIVWTSMHRRRARLLERPPRGLGRRPGVSPT